MATLVKFRGVDRANSSSDVLLGTTTPSTPIAQRGVRIKAAQGPVHPQGTKASKVLGTLTATARYGGTWANTNVLFGIVNGGVSQSLSLTVSYGATGALSIQVNPATNGSSVITSTEAQVRDLVNADPIASQFVTLATTAGASVATAGAVAVLTGGAALTSTTESLWLRANSKASVVVDIEDGLVAKIVRRNKDRLVSLGAVGTVA